MSPDEDAIVRSPQTTRPVTGEQFPELGLAASMSFARFAPQHWPPAQPATPEASHARHRPSQQGKPDALEDSALRRVRQTHRRQLARTTNELSVQSRSLERLSRYSAARASRFHALIHFISRSQTPNRSAGFGESRCCSRMKKSRIFALLLISMLCAVAGAQTTDKEWQAKAVQKYPELGVQGSDFNKRFIAEHNKRRNTSPAFFANSKWPLILADELAAKPPAPTLSVWSSTWKAFSPEARLIVFLGAVAMALAICHTANKRFQRWLHWKRICADSDAYFALLDDSTGLPTTPTNVMLQYDERAFYCAPSALFETEPCVTISQVP